MFVRLTEGCDIRSVNDKLNELFKDTESVYGKLSLMRSDEFYFSEGNVFLEKGEAGLIRNMTAAGAALLLLALLNYINLNTALVGKRSVEMATRRLLGSGRKDIFMKYVSESVAFTALCFCIAVMIAAALTPVLGRLAMDAESVSSSALFNVADIFGATSSEETLRNLKLYFGITLTADILAVPVALVGFSYRMELSAWIFIATVLISLAITFVSVIFQVRRAAGVNPAETLKKE